MGKSLVENFPVAKQTFEEAEEALKIKLRSICFDGPESELTQSENTQPAIVTTSVATARVVRSLYGIEPDLVLGHSLGEYAALVVAGALPFATAVTWVRARGQAMQRAVPVGQGAMAAILGAERTQLEEWCKSASAATKEARAASPEKAQMFAVAPTVEIANDNAPGQIVVSGSVDAVDQLETMIKAAGVRGILAKRLNVSAPFHCSLMKPARTEMETLFARDAKKVSDLKTAYIPNRTARITRESGVILPLLAEQVDHQVRWVESFETVMSAGYTQAIEFGPGKVLQGLAKRICKGKTEINVVSVFDLESLTQNEGQLK